ncbi:MAG: substrate-binding domain-containing protein [Alphaproteobacteria bacterium]
MKNIIKFCIAAVIGATLAFSAVAKDNVRVGFLVKQAEEPWFQTEWKFAEKAAADNGFELLKIAVPDAERTLSAIDTLAAKGAVGFVICAPDVRLGPAIMAKAKAAGLKVVTVDDRFVGSDGKFMEEVPYMGMDAHAVGIEAGNVLITEAKNRGWDFSETGLVINSYDELDTIQQRTSGVIKAVTAGGFPEANIYAAPLRALEIPASFDATNIVLTKYPNIKHWLVAGGNDNSVLGGVRAIEGAGFKPEDIIGVGINGTDVVAEFEKTDVTGMYASMLPKPDVHGYETTMMVYNWAVKNEEPKLFNPIGNPTVLTRDNFKEELSKLGLLN